MFYNSKKLIDEKVLQQYYFESFMLADSTSRKKLLPKKYSSYSATKEIKGLNPEVRVGQKRDGGTHITDFVLYPMPSSSSKLSKLNIELKWIVKDFESQPERFLHYNGEVSDGFVVALKDDKYSPEFINNGKIPAVYLCPEEFKRWFTKKSYGIVSQALANKIGTKPSRLSGERFWVVCIVDASEKHYLDHGRTNNIWAFRDNNNPKNIMNILDGDYIIFVHFDNCKPGRAVYPYSNKTNTKFHKVRGGYLSNNEISWTIDLVDIRKVDKGYHLNYTSKAPYDGFDENWLAEQEQLPEKKNYTQFVTFKKASNDQFEFIWNCPDGVRLNRELFSNEKAESRNFVTAVRSSMNTRGDAIEISRGAFESILHLVTTL